MVIIQGVVNMKLIKKVSSFIIDRLVKEGEVMQKAGYFNNGFYM